MHRAEISSTVRHLKREATVIEQAFENGDRAKASSSIASCHSMLSRLNELTKLLPTPPNERPGYSYNSVRPPN